MIRRFGLTLLLLAGPVQAQTATPAPLADTQLPDPVQEAEAKALMETLRCVVCQGQSIADSDASRAGDMRALVRTRIRAGDRPAAIRQWLIDRYGSYISYDPPLEAATWPLWMVPILFLALGGWIARGSFRRRGER